jgi:hypothetical protein
MRLNGDKPKPAITAGNRKPSSFYKTTVSYRNYTVKCEKISGKYE